MFLTQVNIVSTYPVTLVDLKLHLAIDGNTEDSRLTAMIGAATNLCETQTNRAFVSQTWKLTDCGFPRYQLYLPKPPLTGVTTVKYYDSNNVQQTWDAANYYVMKGTKSHGWIEPTTAYPATYNRPDAIEVTFTCGGYGTEQVGHAIKLICGQWNEGREGKEEIPPSAMSILNSLWTGEYK